VVQKPKSDFEREMIYLEAEIRRLEAEFNMFFAGRLPRPPWETRAKVATLIKKHDQGFIRNTADRFRFESLQHRHQKFLELWERQMTNRELGRQTIGAKRAAPAPAPVKQAAESPEPSLIRFARDQEPTAESDRVKQLFDQLAAAKKQVGETPVAIDRLAALVKAQVEKFSAEGRDVSFKVALKDGKVSLTVKPVEN
jgi:hypothetical protein